MNCETGEQILIVENHNATRDMMRHLLGTEGYRVACAGNGRESLECSHEGEPPSSCRSSPLEARAAGHSGTGIAYSDEGNRPEIPCFGCGVRLLPIVNFVTGA